MPQCWYDGPNPLKKELFHPVGIDRHRMVEKPAKCDGSIKDKTAQLRPSSIRSLTFTPRPSLARFRIFSISLKISFKLAAGAAGTRTAASSPRRVMPIFSPSRARSTSSETEVLANDQLFARFKKISCGSATGRGNGSEDEICPTLQAACG